MRQRGSVPHSPKAKQMEAKTDQACRTTPIKERIPEGESKLPTRVGISISQKVSKLAVIRNRIKRQIRAALRHMLPQISPGWLLVIVVLHGAQECDYAQILRELEQLLVEAEVLNGH